LDEGWALLSVAFRSLSDLEADRRPIVNDCF